MEDTLQCCESMADDLAQKFDEHSDPFNCADVLIYFSEQKSEYGIIIHDDGASYSAITFCPVVRSESLSAFNKLHHYGQLQFSSGRSKCSKRMLFHPGLQNSYNAALTLVEDFRKIAVSSLSLCSNAGLPNSIEVTSQIGMITPAEFAERDCRRRIEALPTSAHS